MTIYLVNKQMETFRKSEDPKEDDNSSNKRASNNLIEHLNLQGVLKVSYDNVSLDRIQHYRTPETGIALIIPTENTMNQNRGPDRSRNRGKCE